MTFGSRKGDEPVGVSPKDIPRKQRKVEVHCPAHRGLVIAVMTEDLLITTTRSYELTGLGGPAITGCSKCPDLAFEYTVSVPKLVEALAVQERRPAVVVADPKP